MARGGTHNEGVEIAFEDFGGDGEVALLIAGATLPGDSFVSAFVDELGAVGLRTVRYDQRDTGRSTRIDDDVEYSLRDMAKDALAVLTALGIDAAHVVTFSLGGPVATLLALEHPECVRSLALIASPSPDLTHGLGAGALDSGYFGGPDDVVEAMIRNMGSHDEADEDWLRDEVRLWSKRAGAWSLAPVGKHMGAAIRTTPPTFEALQALTMPSLVIHGGLDDEVPIAHAHTLAEWLPNAQLELVESLGHIPTETQWSLIGRRVAAFIKTAGPAEPEQ